MATQPDWLGSALVTGVTGSGCRATAAVDAVSLGEPRARHSGWFHLLWFTVREPVTGNCPETPGCAKTAPERVAS